MQLEKEQPILTFIANTFKGSYALFFDRKDYNLDDFEGYIKGQLETFKTNNLKEEEKEFLTGPKAKEYIKINMEWYKSLLSFNEKYGMN